MFESDKTATAEMLKKCGIIVILRNLPEEKTLPLAEALLKGGIKAVEIAFSDSGKIPDTVVANQIKMLSNAFNGKMLIGAGTVLTANQVRLAKDSGASFVASPVTDSTVILEAHNFNMATISGAFTPTEIISARTSGADIVKLFPAASLGVAYVKSVLTPIKNVSVFGFGGITEDNLREYKNAGISGFGISTGIVSDKDIENEDYVSVQNKAEKYLSLLQM